MKLATLAAFRPRDLLIPLRPDCPWPDSVPAHLGAHVLGGVAFWAVGVWVLGLDPWRAAVLAGFVEGFRQNVVNEVQPDNFPLWAMIWDTATAGLAGVGCALAAIAIG